MKKQGKKIFGIPIAFLVIGILGLGGVSAGLVQFFGQRTTTIDVELPIDVIGDTTNYLDEMGCYTVKGSDLTIVNKADFGIDVEITSTEEEGVTTSYVGTLELSGKSACYAEGDCLLKDEPKATVYYTIVGNEFDYRVESSDIDVSEYTLVYYPDIEGYASEDYTGYVILADEVTESLPMDNDLNKVNDEYCTNGKNPEGVNCYGAKLWLVLTSDIEDNYIQEWNGDSYLFETDLIQYSDTGIITMYPEDSLTFNPLFDLDCMLSGTVIITTTVDIKEV